MNLSSLTTGSGVVTIVIVVAGVLLLALLTRWGWKQYRRNKVSADTSYPISTDSLDADQFIFDDTDNELQSKLEAKLSSPQKAAHNKQLAASLTDKTNRKAKPKPARQTKQAIGLAGTSSVTSFNTTAEDAVNTGKIEKSDIAMLVSVIKSLDQKSLAQTPEPEPAGDRVQTALIDAAEIERLSFHLESTNREIASLAEELAAQRRKVSELEKDTPDVARQDVHNKITLLANSIIERNASIKSLGASYKNNVALAAKIAKTDPEESHRLLQQCKVIKLQIKLEGQNLEKERVLMSDHTRLHRALLAPQSARTSSMLQLADQTNEIRSQNANLKSMVDKLDAEFSQLRSIVDGLKSNIEFNPAKVNISAGTDQATVEDKRAANDASIAAARASASSSSTKSTNDPSRLNR